MGLWREGLCSDTYCVPLIVQIHALFKPTIRP